MKSFTLYSYYGKKKLIVALGLFMLIACDPGDIDLDGFHTFNWDWAPTGLYTSHFMPPNWIHGLWQGSKEDTLRSPKYDRIEFTINNFIGSEWEQYDTPIVDYNELIINSPSEYVVQESIGEESYEIIVTHATIKTSYKFVKESDTKILYYYQFNKDVSDPEPPFILYKVE